MKIESLLSMVRRWRRVPGIVGGGGGGGGGGGATEKEGMAHELTRNLPMRLKEREGWGNSGARET